MSAQNVVPETLARQAVRCAVHTARLLEERHLHLRRSRTGVSVSLPDGRSFMVFRESYCDTGESAAPVVLAVWFHLWSIPPGAVRRRWLFEHLCILNTVLFAGFDGFLVKLWMVDAATSDYAGLYSWASAREAERYGHYITAILGPLSTRGSVGFEIVTDSTLEDFAQPV